MNFSDSYRTTLAGGRVFEVETRKGVFYPTYTSELILKAISDENTLGISLDLGCGCGIVGLAAAVLGRCQLPLYGSDVSPDAVELARQNAERAGVGCDFRAGSLFDPWKGMRFDTILDDVAGIAEEIASASSWYNHGVPCAAGPDGATLTLRMLELAPEHLNPGGKLFFPVISLSDTDRILNAANSRFGRLECIAEQSWMLPDDLSSDTDRLERLQKEGRISYEERFGTILCWTKIYRAEV